ncbi:MAG: DUF2071 domain-containing protein [Verrucomicrobiaceae bacterium]|nr:DUF2071 domain-containing protein [Verrucomicrobiaceae bacterium]
MNLRHHPFAVEAFFDASVVLTYAVDVEEARQWVPPCVELDLLDDQTAFFAVAMVTTRHLRPAGFPKWFGQDFFLTGYRLFVRYRAQNGRSLRGLYILRSETDRWRMVLLGNLFTQYQYHHVKTSVDAFWPCWSVNCRGSGLEVAIKTTNDEEPPLPAGSPFRDWHQARLFAGPMPFTFSFDSKKSRVVIVEGQRETWKPRPVLVEKAKVGFIEEMGWKTARLASAFVVRNVPYRWKAGRIETWSPG